MFLSRTFSFNIFMCIVLARPLYGFSVSQSQNVTVGDEVIMTCHTDDTKHVAWRFTEPGNRPITISHNCTVGNTYKDHVIQDCSTPNQHKLIIPRVTLNLSGTYECIENNGVGRGSGSIQISVLPRTFSVSSSAVVKVGEKAILRCVTGLNKHVIWRFYHTVGARPDTLSASENIVNSYKRHYQLEISGYGDYNLIIPQARLYNTGTYECIENVGLGPGKGTVELTVTLLVSTPQIVQTGNTAILPCASVSDDTVDWTYSSPTDGQMVISSGGSVLTAHQGTFGFMNVGDDKHYLVIRNVAKNHTGTYQCHTGVTGEQQVLASTSLNVMTSNSQEVKREFGTVGGTTVLQCDTDSNQSITWIFCKLNSKMETCRTVPSNDEYHSRVVNETNDEYHSRVVVGRSSIMINRVTMNDTGMYYCKDKDQLHQLAEPRDSIHLTVFLPEVTDSGHVTTYLPISTSSQENSGVSIVPVVMVLVIVLVLVALAMPIFILLIWKFLRRKPLKPIPIRVPDNQLDNKYYDRVKSVPLLESEHLQCTVQPLESEHKPENVKEDIEVVFVASLNDHVFVLNGSSRSLDVYNAKSNELVRTIGDIGDQSSVFIGLASSTMDNCLYIGDRTGRRVIRLEPTNDVDVPQYKTQEWPLKVSPISLSVSTYDNHNVIVAAEGRPCEIREYDKYGLHVRVLTLPSVVYKLRQVVQLRDQYLLNYINDECQEQVGLVDKGGALVTRWDNIRVTDIGVQLRDNIHDITDIGVNLRDTITIDEDGNIIISEEKENDRLLSLSKWIKQSVTSISRLIQDESEQTVGSISNSNGYVYTYRRGVQASRPPDDSTLITTC